MAWIHFCHFRYQQFQILKSIFSSHFRICSNILLQKVKKSKVQVFDTPQVVNCFKVESDAALLSSWFNKLRTFPKRTENIHV